MLSLIYVHGSKSHAHYVSGISPLQNTWSEGYIYIADKQTHLLINTATLWCHMIRALDLTCCVTEVTHHQQVHIMMQI